MSDQVDYDAVRAASAATWAEKKSDGEKARRLARYDEALSLIEEFLRDGLEPQLARRAEVFLAAEGKVAG